MKIRPLNDCVLVLRDPKEAMTKGGIALPEKNARKSVRGEVIAVGPGERLENGARKAMNLKPGFRVLFSNKAGEQVDPKDENLLMIREADVAGVFRDELE